jgi:predicted RecB family nuclease
MHITSSLFDAYLKCPTKCFLRSQGETSAENAYADWVRDQNESYRSSGIEHLMAGIASDECAINPPAEENLATAQWRLAVDFVLRTQDLEAHLHAVERIPSEGRGRPAQIIPIRFIFTNKLTRDDRLLLAFDALVLSEVLGREVSLGKIIHGDDHATLKVKTSGLVGEVRKRLDGIAGLLPAPAPPDLILIRHCAECQFQAACRQWTVEKDDLSLLGGMSETERARHQGKGIFTVNQLSYTFRPRRTPKRAKHPAKPHHFALQALAIRENTVYIHGTPELPECQSRVYLDIEGLPDRDFYYLIGALVVSDGQERLHSFWADGEADQTAIFLQLAQMVCGLPDFRVFHYGDYDTTALKKVAATLPETAGAQIKAILGRCVNVLSLVYPHVYFPAYSTGLKSIGKYLGCQQAQPDTTGLDSIVWRNNWEAEHSLEQKRMLVEYNHNDCLLLRRLTDFILANTRSISPNEDSGANVKHTKDIQTSRPRWRMFARKDYALEDLHYINKCGYFDYQRDKVFVKTHKPFRRMGKSRQVTKSRHIRASKTLDIVYKKCPVCMSKTLQPTSHRSQHSLDLRFTRSGVKRSVTCMRCWSYRCPKCGMTAAARPKFSTRHTYGHGLICGFIYLNVVCGLNMLMVQKCLEQIWGIRVEEPQLYRFKSYTAATYAPLDNELRETIVRSRVIHIDETTVDLRSQAGYVWVVTTMDMVHFFYRSSREASFLSELLGGFSGILVSDFFTGYDSVPCLQQKCLVHLVRELDDDLIHNPFNEQFKWLAQGFGSLLRPIIETIDRYGLKKLHLHKHARATERFRQSVEVLRPDSDLVDKYRKRFIKYWPKMFTFLGHDGVPWNNNNAEHAIKRFAKYRRNADGRYTERSLNEYLVLASVLETCEFNKVNVLKFLLSQETTLSGLLRMAGRKPTSLGAVPTQDSPATGTVGTDI